MTAAVARLDTSGLEPPVPGERAEVGDESFPVYVLCLALLEAHRVRVSFRETAASAGRAATCCTWVSSVTCVLLLRILPGVSPFLGTWDIAAPQAHGVGATHLHTPNAPFCHHSEWKIRSAAGSWTHRWPPYRVDGRAPHHPRNVLEGGRRELLDPAGVWVGSSFSGPCRG